VQQAHIGNKVDNDEVVVEGEEVEDSNIGSNE